MHVEKLLGHVCEQAGTVGCHNMQRRLELFLDFTRPVRTHPALRLRRLREILRHVRAAAFVDGNAETARDEADDLIARQRVSAAGELDDSCPYLYEHAAPPLVECSGGGFAAAISCCGSGAGLWVFWYSSFTRGRSFQS